MGEIGLIDLFLISHFHLIRKLPGVSLVAAHIREMAAALFLLLFFVAFSDATTIIRGDPVAISTYHPQFLVLSKSRGNGYNWTEEWFEQMPIDHFSFTDARRFKLR